MAIEKGVYAAPEGIDSIDLEDELDGELVESELEIEIVDPEMVTLSDGSMEITIIPGLEDEDMMDFDSNLVDFLDEGLLNELSDELISMVDSDVESRKDWADTYVKGLDILGFKHEERTTPWQGACGVNSTVLAEAAIRFQAETMSETFPAAGPVKVKVLGKETKEKLEASERVKADMNYELTENMVEYRPEHERMLYSLGLAGSAFKKVYFDPNLGRQVAIYIPAEDVIVPYGASNIESAERVCHIMRKTKNDVMKLQVSGFYAGIELGDPESYHTDIEKRKAEEGGYDITDDERYTIYEIHADLIIDGVDDEDGIAKPYIVTIERGTTEVLAIRRNWDEEDNLTLKRQHFVHYVYVPGFGFYGLGLIHIIGGYAKAGTSLIRQLVDAGTLSNLPGGLKSRGLRIKGDDSPIEPGEWKDVDVPSGSIRENIMPLPYKEPSQTLLALLNQITTEGRRLGAVADMDISDMSANAPVGTTLALLERTLKPMAAVMARVHYAMKLEFKMLKAIMAEEAPEEYTYQPNRGEVSARQSDYAMVDVIPVSDPNSSTMAQRVVQYQAVLQMSQQAPQIYNLPQLHRQMIEVLGVKNADKLVPTEDDAVPTDPVSENMNALTGTPIKAFIYQDHEAHISAHQSFMKDPMVAGTIGQNPQAQQIMAALNAHIAEHLGFRYRAQMEEKLGVELPAPNQELSEEMEVQLAKLVAEGGKQLTAQHEQEAAQKQAQQKQQDPIIQLQQAELQVKQQEVQRKAQKDQADTQLKQADLERKTQKDLADIQINKQQLDIENQELQIDAQKAGAKLAADRKTANTKLDLDLMKATSEAENKRNKE
jgi:hypothetical protein|tara:strand:- start:2715 stop:5198 length:2484 start_codon:yes stop_codon:yes gene_type:complete